MPRSFTTIVKPHGYRILLVVVQLRGIKPKVRELFAACLTAHRPSLFNTRLIEQEHAPDLVARPRDRVSVSFLSDTFTSGKIRLLYYGF